VDAASRFLDACEEAFRELERMPRLGRVREFHDPALKGIRTWFVKGFEKHLIFYRPTETGIEIIRVLHSARDIDRIFDEEL
jgi:toxin ParE1/3/4